MNTLINFIPSPEMVTTGIIGVTAFFSGIFSGVIIGAKMENNVQKSKRNKLKKKREQFLKQVSEAKCMDSERFIGDKNEAPAIERRQAETTAKAKSEISFESEPETGFAFLTTRMISAEEQQDNKNSKSSNVIPMPEKRFLDRVA